MTHQQPAHAFWRTALATVAFSFLALVLASCAAPQPPGDAGAAVAARAVTSPRLDAIPRLAIMSAFEPELTLLRSRLAQPRHFSINGVEFTRGTLEGQPVVLLLSGVSMVNAAMNTQLLFDRFHVTHLLFSGIAGGVNPALTIGDVVVPARWGQYLEIIMTRTPGSGEFDIETPAAGDVPQFPPYGVMQPRAVRVRRAGQTGFEKKFWFDVDPRMLAVARAMPPTTLRDCDAAGACIAKKPRVVFGGNGVSGSAFVDNADFRRYAFATFHANVLDMESAACATVAYSNRVPFLAFRSLSDLAGGGAGANEMHTFLNLAADNSAAVILQFVRAWQAANPAPGVGAVQPGTAPANE